MSNLAVLAIIIPLLAGIIVAFTNKHLTLTRTLTKIFSIINLIIVTITTWIVFTQDTLVLETGSWAAPYGIVFVADPLAIILVLTTNILATACAFYAPS